MVQVTKVPCNLRGSTIFRSGCIILLNRNCIRVTNGGHHLCGLVGKPSSRQAAKFYFHAVSRNRRGQDLSSAGRELVWHLGRLTWLDLGTMQQAVKIWNWSRSDMDFKGWSRSEFEVRWIWNWIRWQTQIWCRLTIQTQSTTTSPPTAAQFSPLINSWLRIQLAALCRMLILGRMTNGVALMGCAVSHTETTPLQPRPISIW